MLFRLRRAACNGSLVREWRKGGGDAFVPLECRRFRIAEGAGRPHDVKDLLSFMWILNELRLGFCVGINDSNVNSVLLKFLLDFL